MKTLHLASAVAALLLAASAGARADQLPWTFTGCGYAHGSSLTLANCAACPVYLGGNAVFTAPVQGTVFMRLEWEVEGDNSFTELVVSTPLATVFSIGSPPAAGSWCATPCSGSEPLISAHLLAGQKLTLALSTQPAFCVPGTSTSCFFSEIEFIPDVGIVPAPGALDSSVLATVGGDGLKHELGLAVAAPGDLDGDGLADFVGTADPDSGSVVRGFSSATGAVLFTSSEPPGNPGYGNVLASPGDVDGDGLGDILLGSAATWGQGFVISGADGHTIHVLEPATPDESLALDVSAIGDLDLDGVPDLLVGAELFDGPGHWSGAARVYSGADASQLLQVTGASGERLGNGLASPGDVTGDGLPDFAAGAYTAYVFGLDKGAVRLFSGADGAMLAEWSGPPTETNFGKTLAAAGDLDGDGVGDLLASKSTADTNGNTSGHVRAWSGATLALIFESDGEPGDHLGLALAAAGDWNGDGFGDVYAGAPYAKDARGKVVVLDGPTGQPLKSFTSGPLVAANDHFGVACAVGGDVDGDGRADLIVGAELVEVDALLNAGRIFVLSGDQGDHTPPTLAGQGTLLPASPLSFELADGPAGGAVALVVGLAQANLPFKGGLLVPTPSLLLPLVLDGAGALQLATQWPAGIPSGTMLWLQVWAPEPEALHGFVASDALQLIAP